MAHEIERKFLVRNGGWRADADGGRAFRQAYLAVNEAVSIRIRIKDDREATLTIKSRAPDLRRQEFEYEIPVADAVEMMRMCSGAIISKTRYRVACGPLAWEIDVFEGENEGLLIAEIELDDEDQAFEHPSWLGQEITSVERYYNSSLARHPFCRWPHAASLVVPASERRPAALANRASRRHPRG